MRAMATALLTAGLAAATLTLPGTPAVASGRAPDDVHRWSVEQAREQLPIRVGRPSDGSPRRAAAERSASRVPAALSSTPLSTWQVTFETIATSGGRCTSATQVQKDAFNRAVDTWAHAVASDVTITVDACFRNLPTGQLGGAGPTGFQSFGGVWFPDALGNALRGVDGAPGQPDIVAEFSRASGLYYYGASAEGIDAACPSGCYDFESVVLHELGHGLGFISSFDSVSGKGTYGFSSGDQRPFAFDLFCETTGGTALLAYPYGSVALHNALTSNVVYWNGPEGGGADRGREPRLYAPLGWEGGSSLSHLSDQSYPAGDADSLMTPFAEENDVTRDPGEVMLGMFRDMGWRTPSLPGASYVPLAGPVQVLDWGVVGDGAVKDVAVAGRNGVPTNAVAVVLNLTGAATTSRNTQLFAYAKPRAAPAPPPARVPSLVTAGASTKDGLATVPLGSGSVRFRNTSGSARNYASVLGYYVKAGGAPFAAATPKRILDTRTGLGTAKSRVGSSSRSVALAGVPSTAVAVALNVTGINASNTSTVQVYSSDLVTPATGNVHLKPGQSGTNLVVVRPGADDKVKLRVTLGNADVVLDIAGWYDASAPALFRPVLPQRVSPAAKLGATVRDVKVLGEGFGVPAGATALVLDTVASFPTATTFMSTYPKGDFPGITTLTVNAGKSATGPTITKPSPGGSVRIRNTSGSSTVSLDLFGYFAP